METTNDLLRELNENIKILTRTVKEDMAFRIKSKNTGYDLAVLTTTTADQKHTFSEPLSDFAIAVPTFGSATEVYVNLEASSGTHSIRLTPIVPALSFDDLNVRSFSYSSNVAGATVQIIGTRGL